MFLTPDHELDLILLQQWLLRCDVTILPPSLEEMSFLNDHRRLIVRKKCKYLTKWQMLLLFLVGGKSFKLEGSPKQDWKVTKITLWAKWTVAMWADVKLIMWNCYPGRRGRESPVISHCCQLQNKATVVTTHFSLIRNTYKLYAAWHNFMNIHFIPFSALLHWLTGSGQVLDLDGDLDVGLGGQGEAATLADAIAQQGDVLLEAGCVPREPQHGASGLGQGCGLVLGAPWQAGP